jgi:hypothetical protein
VFVLLIAAVTSAVALALLGRRRPAASLRRAGVRALECLGLAVAFFVADLVVGVLMILAVRATGRFASIYGLSDPTLLVLALLQAIVVHHWIIDRSTDRPC